MKLIKRISALVLILLFYFVVREAVDFYNFLNQINNVLAIAVMIILGLLFIYYGIIPVIQIIVMPVNYGPAKHKNEVNKLRKNRIEKFGKNKFLMNHKDIKIEFITDTDEDYEKVIKLLEYECGNIRKKYITQLFYSTSISQNGFLDAIIIFSTSINLIKEIFILYRGRVSNRDLITIAKKIYFALLVGGSEGIENATEEIFSKFATEGMKSIPFLDKIMSSLVDGFINAALVTRISLITENYCKLLFAENDKKLYPSYKTVVSTTKIILSDILSKSKTGLVEVSKEKGKAIWDMAANPVMLIFEKSGQFVKKSVRAGKDTVFVHSGFSRLKNLFGFGNNN